MSQEKLNSLKLRKSRLLSEIEMLTEVSPLMYRNLGKLTADIYLLEKKLLRDNASIYAD
ncbi:hypothetical protein V3Q77_08240 [Flavobacterium davisii]|uniref:Uncharacterized protein n=1 Tax=Flavobacterium davisii TaxID=2906077 RepID=A0ABW8PPH0_9FLAO